MHNDHGRLISVKRGSTVELTRLGEPVTTAMIHYDTREPVTHAIVDDQHVIKLLVPKGEYLATWQPDRKNMELRSDVLDARDPMDLAFQIPFRDGRPLWMRPGRWDKFIVSERPYRKLPIIEGSTVLDAGGHIGTFARDAVAAGAGRVVTYEPEHVNYAFHCANTEGLPVEHVKAAIGREAGRATFHLNLLGEGGGNALHTLYDRDVAFPRVTVPVERLSDVCAKTGATSIKLDVEGAEEWYDYENLPDCVRYIAVEFKKKFVEDNILAAGFTTVIKQPTYKGFSCLGVWGRP